MHDDHFALDGFRRFLQAANILGHHAVDLRVAERLVEYAMCMANGAVGKSGLMQRVVPTFDIEPRELLQRLGAEMWHDLVFGQLAIALSRSGGDVVRPASH